MKKMKKIAATLLCLGVAISILCACSSTSNGGEQPVEEPTTKQTEAVTETTETTTELTESETTESETQEGDVIIELYEPVGKIQDVDPNALKSNFDAFFGYFELGPADIVADGHTLFQLTFKGHNFDVCTQSGEIYNIDIYFYPNEYYNITEIYLYINGNEGPMGIDFIPLFYNQTKHCFVGYTYSEGDEAGSFSSYPGLYEMYYVPEVNDWIREPVGDLSIYGYKT